jgi:hypothetical protein
VPALYARLNRPRVSRSTISDTISSKGHSETEARTVHVREAGIRWVWANPDGSERAWYEAFRYRESSHVDPEDKDQFPYV